MENKELEIKRCLFRLLKETNTYKTFKLRLSYLMTFKGFDMHKTMEKLGREEHWSDFFVNFNGDSFVSGIYGSRDNNMLPTYIDRVWCVFCDYFFENKNRGIRNYSIFLEEPYIRDSKEGTELMKILGKKLNLK